MSSASSSSSVAGIRKRGRQDEPNTPVPPPSTRLNQPTSPLIRNSSAPSDPSPAQRGQTPLGSPVHAALTASPIGSTVEQRKQTLLYQLSPLYIPSTLPSLEEHKRTLYELLERTMTSQHNNACLLVGYSGSGKTALTRSVLHDLRRHYQPLGRSFTVVYLNGRLHADDTLAMREIVRQLSVDMEVEKPPASADFNTNLAFLQTLLASSHYTSQPVFFILDNFDLFAHPPPAKQTLLYNLCDLLQSSRSQLALLAHTVRIDAFDLLEKRIKSRMFSRRLLFPHLPKEEQVVAVVRDRLLLDGERLKRGLRRPSGRGGVEEFDFVPGDTVEGEDDEWMSGEVSVELERHNEAVERMLADETLRATLAHHFKLGKNVRWFLTILTYAVCQMRSDSPYPLAEQFLYAEQRPFDHDIPSTASHSPDADLFRSSASLLSSPFSLTSYASPSTSPPSSSPISSSPGSLSPVSAHSLPLPPSSVARPLWVSSRWYAVVMAALVLLAVQQWIVADRAKLLPR